MKNLWSPWRMEYIQSAKVDGCVFCLAQTDGCDADNYVFARGKRVFLILNRYPYSSGHVMVVPYAHQSNMNGLDAETRAEMIEFTNLAIGALQLAYNPQGFNVGINIGEAAGAGIAEHLHLHVVPRWNGDTNFMSSLAGTRVLPEALEETYRRLSEAWERRRNQPDG